MTEALIIRDASTAAAAARCLAARVLDRDRWILRRHPSRCAWCDVPRDVLDATVQRFNELAAYDARNRTSVTDAALFTSLPRDEQERQVLVAQLLEDEPPPSRAHLAAVALAAAAAAVPKRDRHVAGSARRRSRSIEEGSTEPTAEQLSPPDPPAQPDWFGGPS